MQLQQRGDVASEEQSRGAYIVSEAEWLRLNEVRGGLGALMDLADGPPRKIKLDSEQFMALVSIWSGYLGAVIDGATFSAGGVAT